MKKCPYCAEEIQDEAIKCKHYGEWLNRKSEEKPIEPNVPIDKSEERPLDSGVPIEKREETKHATKIENKPVGAPLR